MPGTCTSYIALPWRSLRGTEGISCQSPLTLWLLCLARLELQRTTCVPLLRTLVLLATTTATPAIINTTIARVDPAYSVSHSDFRRVAPVAGFSSQSATPGTRKMAKTGDTERAKLLLEDFAIGGTPPSLVVPLSCRNLSSLANSSQNRIQKRISWGLGVALPGRYIMECMIYDGFQPLCTACSVRSRSGYCTHRNGQSCDKIIIRTVQIGKYRWANICCLMDVWRLVVIISLLSPVALYSQLQLSSWTFSDGCDEASVFRLSAFFSGLLFARDNMLHNKHACFV